MKTHTHRVCGWKRSAALPVEQLKRGLVCSQFPDADVMAWSAEDGGGDQKGPDSHELHQVTQQPGCPTDCVRMVFATEALEIYGV